MGVDMEQRPNIEGGQGRRGRRTMSTRESFAGSLSTSPANLDQLGTPAKYPRRMITPHPLRFALRTCKGLFNPKSSPPPSPTRIHKPTHTTHLLIEPIPRIPIAEPEEPRLTPLDIPNILEQIISRLDEGNTIPCEPPPVRRKPLSYQHALLIYYPDVARAKEVWAAACRPPSDEPRSVRKPSGVYACLFVNHDWHDAAKRVLRRKAFFTSYETWRSFAYGKHSPHLKTLVLHKIRRATDLELGLLGEQPRLEWLEFHVCPDLRPPETLLKSPYLRRLAAPACARISDETLEIVARNCPNLEVLDLRACELVTDKGLITIARGCPKLKYLNVGRIKGGDRVTCDGVDAIARLTNVDTLGLAGCSISDRGIWSIATHRGPKIERLSLNNCVGLSNASIPLILHLTPNLQVLELRGCIKITHVGPIVEFRRKWRSRGVLVEGCEIFEGRMRRGEGQLEREEQSEPRSENRGDSMIIDG